MSEGHLVSSSIGTWGNTTVCLWSNHYHQERKKKAVGYPQLGCNP